MKQEQQSVMPCALGLSLGLLAAVPTANAVPSHAERMSTAAATDTVHAVFVLRGRDDAGLEQRATAVSDPASPEYGRYVPFEESVRRFGPASEAAPAVVRYLKANGLEARTDASGLSVEATLSADKVREIAGVTLARYRAPNGQDSFLAPDGPAAIPGELQAFVAAIDGLDETPVSKRPAKPAATNAPR